MVTTSWELQNVPRSENQPPGSSRSRTSDIFQDVNTYLSGQFVLIKVVVVFIPTGEIALFFFCCKYQKSNRKGSHKLNKEYAVTTKVLTTIVHRQMTRLRDRALVYCVTSPITCNDLRYIGRQTKPPWMMHFLILVLLRQKTPRSQAENLQLCSNPIA